MRRTLYYIARTVSYNILYDIGEIDAGANRPIKNPEFFFYARNYFGSVINSVVMGYDEFCGRGFDGITLESEDCLEYAFMNFNGSCQHHIKFSRMRLFVSFFFLMTQMDVMN